MALNHNRLPHQTVLQSGSVSAKTRTQYLKLLTLIHLTPLLPQETVDDENSWDNRIARMMDCLFIDGYASHVGEKILAAFMWSRPEFSRLGGGRMAKSRQALKGWRKIVPPGGRIPLPYPVVCLLADYFVRSGDVDMALVVLIATEAYCRPSEPLRLRKQDVVPGQPGLGRGLRAVSLLLHPYELRVPSKNQEFDQAIRLDLPRQTALAEALVRRSLTGDPSEPLLLVPPQDLLTKMRAAEDALGLAALGPLHPYRLRHTGASHDLAVGARTIESIQHRGRWRDARSLRRYQHGARLNELFARLSPSVQKLARQAMVAMPKTLSVVGGAPSLKRERTEAFSSQCAKNPKTWSGGPPKGMDGRV